MNGGRKGEFPAILNDCIKRCQASKDSVRYVKVCVEFAENCKDPLAFVAWMERGGIGQQYATFWECKARLLEDKARDTAGAEAAFAEGIRRLAQPVDRLHAKRKELHARVAAALKAGPEACADGEDENGTRMALGALSSAGMTRSTRTGPGQLRSQLPVAQRGNTGRRNPGMQVYEEGDEEQDAGGAFPGREWIDYGSEREAVKENKDVARQWSRTTLPQQPGVTGAAGVANRRPAFPIFDENEPDEVVHAPEPISVPQKTVSAAPVKPTSTAAAAAPGQKKSSSGTKKKTDGPLSPISKPKLKQRTCFDEEQLKGETLTFEGLRAMRWSAGKAVREAEERARLKREEDEAVRRAQVELQEKLRRDREKQQQQQQQKTHLLLQQQQQLQLQQQQQQQQPEVSFAMDTMNYEALVRGAAKTTNLEALDDMDNVYADTIDLRGRNGMGYPQMATINTRAVMDEVDRMFSDNLSLNDSMHSTYVTSRSGLLGVPPPIALSAATNAAARQQDFEVFEDEDSLEVFRNSMSASLVTPATAAAAPIPVSVPAPVAKFEVLEDSFVAPRPTVAAAPAKRAATPKKPAATAKPMAFEVFSDDEEVAPSKAPVAVKAPVSDVVTDPWAAGAQTVTAAKVAQLKGFHDHGKAVPRMESDYFWLGSEAYDLLQIGGGVESSVYRAVSVSGDDDATFALKLYKPARAWEFSILSAFQKRCPKERLSMFPRLVSYHQFAGQSVLVTGYNESGTVASLLETWSKRGGLPEELAVFYACELLRAVEMLHGAGVVHNDITTDNVMLSSDSSGVVDKQSVQLVDFSCALDVTEFSPKSTFVGAGRCSIACPQMASGKAWCFEQDCFALASFIHSLLFGCALDGLTPRPCKEGWQSELWSGIFSSLLSAPHLSAGRYVESQSLLKSLRIKLESYRLQISNHIQRTLSKQAILLFEK